MPDSSAFQIFGQFAARASKLLRSVELRDLRPTLDLPIGRGPVRREEFFWRGGLPAGLTFEVKGVQGPIRVSPSESGQVELMAVKSGRRDRPEEVDIRVVEHEGGVTVGALYPSDDPKQPNVVLPGDAGRMKVRRNDVQVEFTVRLPRGVRFVGRTVIGDVVAQGLTAAVEARTVNGSIEVSLSADDWAGEVQLRTVNGDLRLDLPAETSAEVLASTVNGDVWLDFPLDGAAAKTRKKVGGFIGRAGAGRRLLLKTTNGGVRIGRTRNS